MRWNRLITVVCVFLLRLSQIVLGILLVIIIGATMLGRFEAPLGFHLNDDFQVENHNDFEQFVEVRYKEKVYTEVKLKATEYYLDLKTIPASDLYIIAAMILVGLAFYYLLHLLIKLLKSIEEREFFSLENVKRLRKIGLMLIGFAVLKWLYGHLMNYILLDYLDVKGVYKASSGFQLSLEFFNTTLFLGLMILLIANAFEHGLKLKEEQELTI